MQCPYCDIEMLKVVGILFQVYCPKCLCEFDEEANNGRT